VELVEVTLRAADGHSIGATLFGNGERALLVMPATGVPQSYYAKYAAYLAERGFTVLTFDYRGIGRSRDVPVGRSAARMRDWALLDAAAAAGFFGSRELRIVGHSFGGQVLGLLPGPERIRGALVVGSQSGYWRHWPLLGRLWVWPVVHFALPGTARLLGYFPGSRLGFGEDLPPGVAIEWASWCRQPQYVVGALGVADRYARLRGALRAYAISDDPFAPLSAVEALLALYPSAQHELRRVTPRELQEKSIGHFGFFRERFRDSLWRESADWLEST
jgi:predicted alpha/beta hydrolase